jgi:hypothetical protein
VNQKPIDRLWGTFHGKVVAEWLTSAGEDRRMRLHPDTDLVFERPNGELIPALIGLEFDGASIPVWAWPLIGSPFTGKYRLAAVIHDTLCEIRDRPSAEAHWVFRECLRALGVGRLRARVMYLALMLGGSKW